MKTALTILNIFIMGIACCIVSSLLDMLRYG
jgi:hypothetical protein